MYSEFEKLVAERKALEAERATFYARDEHGEYSHPLYVRQREALQSAFKARFPKKHWSWTNLRALMADEATEIEKSFEPEGKALGEDMTRRMEDVTTRLEAAADPLEVPKAEEFIPWRSSTGCDYSTQGYGANKYSKNSMEAAADYARAADIEVEIRDEVYIKSRGGWRSTGDCMKYTVWVKTTALGLEVLHYKPDLPLREWVRLCWKRGVNPRVYASFLPPGYEEKVGLDYYGGFLPNYEEKAS